MGGIVQVAKALWPKSKQFATLKIVNWYILNPHGHTQNWQPHLRFKRHKEGELIGHLTSEDVDQARTLQLAVRDPGPPENVSNTIAFIERPPTGGDSD